MVTQIAHAIAQPATTTLCSECGTPAKPSRKPRAGERHYCRECRKKGIPRRDAARAFRKRAKEKKVPKL